MAKTEIELNVEEWVGRKEGECCPRMKEGNTFNKNREVEMSVVHMGNGKQNMIFFGEPLNDLWRKEKQGLYLREKE